MSNLSRRLLCPLAFTMCAVLSTAPVQATEEPAAVSEAYSGPLTPAKHDAALGGLQNLTSNLWLLPVLRDLPVWQSGGDAAYIDAATWGSLTEIFSYTGFEVTRCEGLNCSTFDSTWYYSGNHYGSYTMVTITLPSWENISASDDQDLGEPGAAVTLNRSALLLRNSFSTERDFIIGVDGGIISSWGWGNYDLTIFGDIDAYGDFSKKGGGTLTLEGSSQWRDHKVTVAGGVLRGDTESLQTRIHNDAVLEFQQEEDGVYASVLSGNGILRKSGPGVLSFSGINTMSGSVFIDQGRLSLTAEAQLGTSPAVTIASGAFLDLSATTGDRTIGPLVGGGAVLLGQKLLVDETTDTFFSGVISGAGGVVKKGSGTISLSGVNTYTGGTEIEAGRLALVDAGRLDPATLLSLSGGTFDLSSADGDREIGSLAGFNSEIRLGANTVIVGSANQSTSFSGTISGSGGFVKTGAGTLTLESVNSYTGVTSILAGTLSARASSLSNRILNNATLIFDEEATTPAIIAAYDGNISGSGQLLKEGDGILWLRGTNTYTGWTTVNSGTLIGNTESLRGEINNNSLLAFYQVEDGTHSDRIDGEGALLVFGPGVLTLEGANTYSGGTIFSGALQVEEDSNLGDATEGLVMIGGRLLISRDFSSNRPLALFDRDGSASTLDTNGNDMVLSGPLFGSGSLIKEGEGTLTLTGINTFFAFYSIGDLHAFSGTTEVRNGRLTVDRILPGDLTVSAGAEAGGAGFIGGVLTNHGRLARGATIGPIMVGGNVIFTPGSSFTVKADSVGHADQLMLIGPGSSATLQGGTVEVQAARGNYRYDTDYPILTAPGGINGQFATVTSNLVFLTPSLNYGPNTVGLSLIRNDIAYESVAGTEDQRSVARVMSSLRGSGGDIGEVVQQLNVLSASEACQAFDSIAGRDRAALPQVNLLNQRALAQVAAGRLGGLAVVNSGRGNTGSKVAGGQIQLAANDLIASDAPLLYALAGQAAESGGGLYPEYLNGLWLQGYGGAGEINADAPAQDYSYTLGGVALGFDRALNSKATLGLLGAYAKPRLEQDPNLIETSSTQIGAYGRYRHGAVVADLVVTFSADRTESSRLVTVGGLSHQALADYNGHGNTITSELRYTLATSPFILQPLIGLQWSRQKQEAYSEEGAGVLNLAIPATTIDSLRSTLGLGISRFLTKGENGLSFEGRLGWSHEFQEQDAIGATLSGDPSGALFSLAGVDIPRDSAQLGLGLAYDAKAAFRLYLDLDSEFNEVRQELTLTAGLGYRW